MLRLRFIENWLWDDTVTVTASSANASFPVSNLSRFSRAYPWRSSGVASTEYVLVDLGSWGTNPVDTIAILFDPLNGSVFSSDATITIEANNVNVWTSPAVSQELTLDENYSIYSHFFSTDQNYRYWRLKIEDPENPFGYVEVPKLIVGNSLELSQLPNNGFTFQVSDPSVTQSTAYGHVFHDLYPLKKAMAFEYSTLLESDIESLHQLFLRVGRTVPIVVSLDGDAELFDKDRFFLYGRFASDFQAKHAVLSYFDSSVTFTEVL